MSRLLERRKLIADSSVAENETWVVGGFLRGIRKVGKLYFTNIEDTSGNIQALFKNDIEVKKESVVIVEGTLVRRKSVNENAFLGDWELIVTDYEIISEARKTLPFEINQTCDTSLEPLRLKYRYLDLRRGIGHNLKLKSRILSAIRREILDREFIEVHTPSLSVSSQEGANTFDICMENGKIFSLSQSPQLYKQLLMIGGLERYFQIANCFRLEDLRADRQYEFLQIDMEMAFSCREKLFEIVEGSLRRVFKEVLNKNFHAPFDRITYDEALRKYGSDKPDLRLGLELIEYTNLFKDLVNKNSHKEAYGIFLPNCCVHVVEEKWLKVVQTKNSIYILHVKNGVVVKSHLMKENMPEESIPELNKDIGGDDGVIILVTFDEKTMKNALTSLGNLRFYFCRKNKVELDEFKFCWIVDWPLFEYNESKGDWVIAHHLFTKPDAKEPGFSADGVKSLGYDLVVNGVEIGSGSVRNDDLDMQNYVFKLAGLSKEEVESSFGWFLEAFNYGVPPHLGIAIGVDRLVQVLLNTSNIREVIAFPKNNHGSCPLTGAPK